MAYGLFILPSCIEIDCFDCDDRSFFFFFYLLLFYCVFCPNYQWSISFWTRNKIFINQWIETKIGRKKKVPIRREESRTKSRKMSFHLCFRTNCFNFLIFIYVLAVIESIDIPRILSQQGGETVYPLPRIKALQVHPKLNLAALLFAVKWIDVIESKLLVFRKIHIFGWQNMSGADTVKNRAAYTREGRKQLFAVLQSARGSSGNCTSYGVGF